MRGGGLQVQGLEWSNDTWDCSCRVCTESEPAGMGWGLDGMCVGKEIKMD